MEVKQCIRDLSSPHACGLPSGHQGPCDYQYAKAEAGRAALDELHAAQRRLAELRGVHVPRNRASLRAGDWR